MSDLKIPELQNPDTNVILIARDHRDSSVEHYMTLSDAQEYVNTFHDDYRTLKDFIGPAKIQVALLLNDIATDTSNEHCFWAFEDRAIYVQVKSTSQTKDEFEKELQANLDFMYGVGDED